jgi:hypothetical protein
MGWKKLKPIARATDFYLESNRPAYTKAHVDWEHLVTLDYETYWADDYTLSKSSTSEYVRDPRFEAQMVGLKVGLGPVEVIPYNKIRARLRKINWATHDLLCHHTQFDGFILSHHYGIVPRKYYCTLSMARAWLSNDIGAGLDDVSKYLGREGKLDGGKASLNMKGYRAKNMHPQVFAKGMEYCAQDTLECHEIFKTLLPNFSQEEIDLIDLTCQMFCCPVLKLDEKLCRVAMEQEIKERDELLLSIADPDCDATHLDNAALRELTGETARGKAEHDILRALVTPTQAKLYTARKTLGSNEKFADLLRAEGVDPPYKISPTWMKLDREEQEVRIEDKYTYAFAKDDIGFIALMEEADTDRIRELCEARIAVKSNSNITRSERLLRSGANGRAIPVYYKFAAAHTWRFGGGDKMNFQNFKRGGILRRCIYAPRGHVIIWADSSQIEARVNAWLWGQHDLVEDFRAGVDVYSAFGTETVYGYPVSRATPTERHVCKTAILGLGYGMGAEKFRIGLAQGKGGPRVIVSADFAEDVVRAYRKKYSKIAAGWQVCNRIIEDMASGRQGEYKCLRWEKETLWLPNGMRMKYPNLSYDEEEGQWTYTRKGAKVKIYGAKLNENIVQALARIIVAAKQMLAVSRKLPVVMTTHDEICAIVELGANEPSTLKGDDKYNWSAHKVLGEATKAAAFMRQVMREPLDWCPDIPLDCELGYSPQYS